MLDVSAFLTLVTELDAAGWVTANLSAGHPAVAERFGDDNILIHAAVCDNTQKYSLEVCFYFVNSQPSVSQVNMYGLKLSEKLCRLSLTNPLSYTP